MLANFVYLVALFLASPLIVYRMVRHQRYRRGVREKLWGISTARANALCKGRRCIWIHAVSVGEVNLLPRLVAKMERRHPEHRILVSSSTDTGYDLALSRFGSERVFFCPLDFSWAVRRTLQRLRPEKLVLAELELWPNLIRQARRADIDVVVINGRLSQRSCHRYQQFSPLTKPIFASLRYVGCQDDDSLKNFALCGTPPDRMSVTGSLKFDDAPTSRETAEVHACAQWAAVDPWLRVWVVGSTQMGEEQMALQIYRALREEHPKLRMILVPRHKERFAETAGLITRSGLKVRRRSTDPPLSGQKWNSDTVVLIDTIGELRNWWGVAHIATVGGSFGDRGGQNMLEPAGYGAAVSFGPDTRNFQQIAQRLTDHHGAMRVADQDELHAFVERCLTDVRFASDLGKAARQVVQQHCGATERTIRAIYGESPAAKAA